MRGKERKEGFRLIVSLGILMELRNGRKSHLPLRGLFRIMQRGEGEKGPLNFHYTILFYCQLVRPSVARVSVRPTDMSPLSFRVPPERTSAISLSRSSFFFQLTPHFLHPSSNLSSLSLSLSLSLPFTTWAVQCYVTAPRERRRVVYLARPSSSPHTCPRALPRPPAPARSLA